MKLKTTSIDDSSMPTIDELTAQGSMFSSHEANTSPLLPKGQGQGYKPFKLRFSYERDITLSKERINAIFIEELEKWKKEQKKGK